MGAVGVLDVVRSAAIILAVVGLILGISRLIHLLNARWERRRRAVEAWLAVSVERHAAGDPSALEPVLREGRPEVLMRLARLAGDAGAVDLRVRVLRRCLEVEPDEISAAAELGKALIELEKPAEAAAVAGEALKRYAVLSEHGTGFVARYEQFAHQAYHVADERVRVGCRALRRKFLKVGHVGTDYGLKNEHEFFACAYERFVMRLALPDHAFDEVHDADREHGLDAWIRGLTTAPAPAASP